MDESGLRWAEVFPWGSSVLFGKSQSKAVGKNHVFCLQSSQCLRLQKGNTAVTGDGCSGITLQTMRMRSRLWTGGGPWSPTRSPARRTTRQRRPSPSTGNRPVGRRKFDAVMAAVLQGATACRCTCPGRRPVDSLWLHVMPRSSARDARHCEHNPKAAMWRSDVTSLNLASAENPGCEPLPRPCRDSAVCWATSAFAVMSTPLLTLTSQVGLGFTPIAESNTLSLEPNTNPRARCLRRCAVRRGRGGPRRRGLPVGRPRRGAPAVQHRAAAAGGPGRGGRRRQRRRPQHHHRRGAGGRP